MIEVEAKAKIKNPDEIRKKISEIAKFVEKVEKLDDYYSLESGKNYNKKSLRVRKTNGEYQINFKQKISYIKGVHAKKETEFKVSDIKNFLELIKDFGFKKWLTKHKLSEVYEIKKNFHIEINYVKKLGWFVEIEYLSNLSNIKKARSEVLAIAKKLGIKEKQIIKSGYTKMLWEKEKY